MVGIGGVAGRRAMVTKKGRFHDDRDWRGEAAGKGQISR